MKVNNVKKRINSCKGVCKSDILCIITIVSVNALINYETFPSEIYLWNLRNVFDTMFTELFPNVPSVHWI